MRHVVVPSLVALLLTACGQEGDGPPRPASQYKQTPLTEKEKRQMIRDIKGVLGYPYTWGGDTKNEGFDCSGLIQWAYRQQDFGYFTNDGYVYEEISAHDLYHQNTRHLDSLQDMERGDLLFFDPDGDGQITHNSIFHKIGSKGGIWVYDSYSEAGQVMYREVKDFYKKGPLYGEPLKTVLK